MRTHKDDLVIRRVVNHLTRTLILNGLENEAFEAFEFANPTLARKHLESTGMHRGLAGTTLCIDGSDDEANSTVLAEYLFDDSLATLESVDKLCKEICALHDSLVSNNIKFVSLDAIPRRKKPTKRYHR